MEIAITVFMDNKPDYLTGLLLQWQENGTGYPELFKEASRFVIEYPGKYYKWDQDACSDFYLFFYKRLIKLIDGFEYRGISFKALLKNTISWQMTSFYHRNKNSTNMSFCVRYDNFIQAETVCDSEPQRDLELAEPVKKRLGMTADGRIANACLCRRLLMLTLKNAYYVDDLYLAKIAELTGCGLSWLSDAVQELRERGEQRRIRLETYGIRANKAYLEICQIHRELGLCSEYSEEQKLRKKLPSVRTRMQRACRGKNSVLINPTNREIAEIMKIPKGSIDSGLYLLKRELAARPE